MKQTEIFQNMTKVYIKKTNGKYTVREIGTNKKLSMAFTFELDAIAFCNHNNFEIEQP
jgi:hypothetical protein